MKAAGCIKHCDHRRSVVGREREPREGADGGRGIRERRIGEARQPTTYLQESRVVCLEMKAISGSAGGRTQDKIIHASVLNKNPGAEGMSKMAQVSRRKFVGRRE